MSYHPSFLFLPIANSAPFSQLEDQGTQIKDCKGRITSSISGQMTGALAAAAAEDDLSEIGKSRGYKSPGSREEREAKLRFH